MDLPPEVINYILELLPKATRNAVYGEEKELPKLLYEIVHFPDYYSKDERVEWYMAHGILQPFLRFSDIERFIEFYHTPPYIANGSFLRIISVDDNGLLRDVKYEFPEDIEDIRGFIEPQGKELEILEISYKNLMHMVERGHSIKSIDRLRVELDEIKPPMIDQFKVKNLICTVPILQDFKVLQEIKVPISINILPPLYEFSFLPENITSLTLLSAFLKGDLDLSWLHGLKMFRFVSHQQLPNYKISLPTSLESFDVFISNRNSEFSIGQLPELKSLTLHQVGISPNHELPSSLLKLSLLLTRVDCKFPEGLEELSLFCDANAEDYGRFPVSLKSLKIKDEFVRLPDITHLINLETFEASYHSILQEPTEQGIIILPENVKYLKSSNINHCFKLNDNLRHIKMNPGTNSRTMAISSFSEGLEVLQLEVCDYEILQHLPSTLTALTIDRGAPLSRAVVKLPKSLEFLELFLCELDPMILNNGLKYLNLKRCHLTKRFINELPKSLKSLTMIHCRCDEDMNLSEFKIKFMKVYECLLKDKIVLPPTLKILEVEDTDMKDVYETMDFSLVKEVYIHGDPNSDSDDSE